MPSRTDTNSPLAPAKMAKLMGPKLSRPLKRSAQNAAHARQMMENSA
jgi:hypothetical protein